MRTAPTATARPSDTASPKRPEVDSDTDMFTGKAIPAKDHRIQIFLEKNGETILVGCTSFDAFKELFKENGIPMDRVLGLPGYKKSSAGSLIVGQFNVTDFAHSAPLELVRAVRASATSTRLVDALLVNRAVSTGKVAQLPRR